VEPVCKSSESDEPPANFGWRQTSTKAPRCEIFGNGSKEGLELKMLLIRGIDFSERRSHMPPDTNDNVCGGHVQKCEVESGNRAEKTGLKSPTSHY
jgi:hypothetical protein